MFKKVTSQYSNIMGELTGLKAKVEAMETKLTEEVEEIKGQNF